MYRPLKWSPGSVLWGVRRDEDPDTEEEDEYLRAANEALEIAEDRYPGHGCEVFVSRRRRQLSEAIPSTERSNGQEDDAVRGNSDGEGSAAPADSDEKVTEEVSRYGRKRTAKKRY